MGWDAICLVVGNKKPRRVAFSNGGCLVADPPPCVDAKAVNEFGKAGHHLGMVQLRRRGRAAEKAVHEEDDENCHKNGCVENPAGGRQL